MSGNWMLCLKRGIEFLRKDLEFRSVGTSYRALDAIRNQL